MEEPSFWDDPEKSQRTMIELKDLKGTIERYEALETAYEDIETLLEMGYEEEDESLIPEIEQELKDFESAYEELRIGTLLSGEYDKDNAILTLHAGAGGTEHRLCAEVRRPRCAGGAACISLWPARAGTGRRAEGAGNDEVAGAAGEVPQEAWILI